MAEKQFVKREWLERTEAGQFKNSLEGMDEYAGKVAKELCEMFPDVQIMDIQHIFESSFRWQMCCENAQYGGIVNGMKELKD